MFYSSIERIVLSELHKKTGSWVKVEMILGINLTTCWQVGNGNRRPSASVVAAVDSWLRIQKSSEPEFIKEIRGKVVPWLREREKK